MRYEHVKSILWKLIVVAVVIGLVIPIALAQAGDSSVRAGPYNEKMKSIYFEASDPQGIDVIRVFGNDNIQIGSDIIPTWPCNPKVTVKFGVTTNKDKFPLKVSVRDCQRPNKAVDWWRVYTTGETEGAYKDSGFTELYPNTKKYDSLSVGGILAPVNKLDLLAPYIGFASIFAAITVGAAIYIRGIKRRKDG